MTNENNHNQDTDASKAVKRPIIPVSPSQALHPQKVPPPPQKRRSHQAKFQLVIFLNFLMLVVVLITFVGGAALYFGNAAYNEAGPSKQTTSFTVRPGSSLAQIATGLERSGLISNAHVFRFASQAMLGTDTLKAGEFEIKAGASMKQIMETMREGKAILYSFTAPEGLTVHQIFVRMKNSPDLIGDLPEIMPAEGALLPETYKFSRGTSRKELVEQMKKAQINAVERLWQRRNPDTHIQTKEEMVILASIVEKETGRADERSRVAGVFINRLKRGMRLQSDPTIIYGLFGGEGKPKDRPIYRSDIDKKTPYNTYHIDGLPPTPIANPGLKAMEAVLNPSMTDDLFFVADGTGGHAFAVTLKDHNANVARWRKIESDRKKASAAQSN